MTSSCRRPGTFQVNGAAPTVLRVASGTSMVTPSASCPARSGSAAAGTAGPRATRRGSRLVEARSALVDQHRGVEGEQVGVVATLLLPPGVEVRAGDHVGRHPRVVEVEQRLLVDHDVAPPGAVLELLRLLEQATVGLEEAVPGAPLPQHECVPDEQLAGDVRAGGAPRGTTRSATSGTPYRVTRSWASRGLASRPVRLGVGAASPGRRRGAARPTAGRSAAFCRPRAG